MHPEFRRSGICTYFDHCFLRMAIPTQFFFAFSWRLGPYSNDISIIKVASNNDAGISFNSHVKPICLPKRNDILHPGTCFFYTSLLVDDTFTNQQPFLSFFKEPGARWLDGELRKSRIKTLKVWRPFFGPPPCHCSIWTHAGCRMWMVAVPKAFWIRWSVLVCERNTVSVNWLAHSYAMNCFCLSLGLLQGGVDACNGDRSVGARVERKRTKHLTFFFLTVAVP